MTRRSLDSFTSQHGCPSIGNSANQTSEPFGPTPVLKEIKVDAQHFASLSEEGVVNDFANGLPMAERRLVLAVQGQTYGPMFDEKLTHAAWKSKPSWHVISMNDRTLSPAMEEDAAKRAGGVAVKLPDLPRRHAAGTRKSC